jgi:hypothetical protein
MQEVNLQEINWCYIFFKQYNYIQIKERLFRCKSSFAISLALLFIKSFVWIRCTSRRVFVGGALKNITISSIYRIMRCFNLIICNLFSEIIFVLEKGWRQPAAVED